LGHQAGPFTQRPGEKMTQNAKKIVVENIAALSAFPRTHFRNPTGYLADFSQPFGLILARFWPFCLRWPPFWASQATVLDF
jgi:hypothetical protein